MGYAVCVLALAWCLSCHRDIVIALRIVLRVIARHIYVGSEKKTFKRFFKFSSLKVSDLFFTFIFIIKGGFLCPSSEVPSFIIKCRKNFFLGYEQDFQFEYEKEKKRLQFFPFNFKNSKIAIHINNFTNTKTHTNTPQKDF